MLTVKFWDADIRRAEALFKDSPRRFREAIGKTVTAISSKGLGLTKKWAPVITGNLRRSFSLIPTRVQGNLAAGGFGSNAKYAAAVEFGDHGTQMVRAHSRRTALGNVTNVREHQRLANQRERPYIRPALDAAAEAAPFLFEQAINLGTWKAEHDANVAGGVDFKG